MTFVHVDAAMAVPRNKKKRKLRTTIYVLVDPFDRCVRYVGKTRCTLPTRLLRHVKSPTNPAMALWFNDLRARRTAPAIMSLEYVEESEWEDAERGWIHWFRAHGDLLNVDPGGAYRDRDGRKRRIHFGEFQPPVATAMAEATRAGVQFWGEPKVQRQQLDKQPAAGHVFKRRAATTQAPTAGDLCGSSASTRGPVAGGCGGRPRDEQKRGHDACEPLRPL